MAFLPEAVGPSTAIIILAALRAKFGSFDDSESRIERSIYAQMRRIEQMCVRCRPQGCDCSFDICAIPFYQVIKNRVKRNLVTDSPQFGNTALGPHLRAGSNIELYVRIWQNNGTDISSINHPPSGPGKVSNQGRNFV